MKKKTILSIEDDEAIRTMLVELCSAVGHRCLGAGSAREAMEVMQANEVDLILLDLHMPAIRGNQFLKFIRDRGNHTPVIVVSAYLQIDILREVHDLDVRAVLAKPIRVDRFKEEIDRVLEPAT